MVCPVSVTTVIDSTFIFTYLYIKVLVRENIFFYVFMFLLMT